MHSYDRVPAEIESSRDGDVVHSPGIESNIPTENAKSRRNKNPLKRRGSLTILRSLSSGSYASIESNEEDFSSIQDKDGDGDTHQSPLHNKRSYASDDDPSGDNDHFPSDGATALSLSPASPRPIYPSIASSYSDSFDLDDDDDDDVLEANLKRYNLDFSATDKVASLSNGSVTHGAPFARGPSNFNRCTKFATCLWYSFQSVRQQARQRRAQLLLQQTERNCRQSLKICIMTNCDATDSGIFLVAATIVLWILALIFAKNPAVRRGLIVAGILFFIIRVGTRPLYQFFLRQRQKRQHRHQQLEDISHTSAGRKERQCNGQHYHHSAHSDGTLELHVIRGDSNNANILPSTSVGSDPTIAAI